MVENLPGESWLPINRNTKYRYFVSNEGRVKVKDETGETLVRLYRNYTGKGTFADTVNLHYIDKGIKNTSLSTLVAEAFIDGFDASIHGVKRRNLTKGWTVDNMVRVDRTNKQISQKQPITIDDAKPIPNTQGLYKIAKNGKVFYTPTQQVLPTIKVDGRLFVEMEMKDGNPRYQELTKIMEQVWGKDAIKNMKPLKKTERDEIKHLELNFKADAPVANTKQERRQRISFTNNIVVLSSPSLGTTSTELTDAANFLGMPKKSLANRLYNHLQFETVVKGEPVHVQYPDMVDKKPYINVNDRGIKTKRIRIIDVGTGHRYSSVGSLANATKDKISLYTILHHLGRFGAVKVNDTIYKLESLVDADAVNQKNRAGYKRKASVAQPEKQIVETKQADAEPIMGISVSFESGLRGAYKELTEKATSKKDFLALSELAKAMAQIVG